MAADPTYFDFLASKACHAEPNGLSRVPELSGHLFPFQSACVEHLLRVGSGGLFLDTGLGKTLCQLEWCEIARQHGNGMALILTPLAVARQIEREGARFGYQARVIRSQADARPGINICNYDRLHLIDPHSFDVVSLDESSILKSFTGKTTRLLIDSFASHRWRLSATATPAPNDHMELGQHAEFCGIMASNEMLARWFISDQTEMGRYRLKGHGIQAFWDWMASWSRMAQSPSDMGFSDDGFELPPLQVYRHRAHESAPTVSGGLFGDAVMSATSMHEVKRQTADRRAEVAANLVMADAESWVIWVDTDYEADALWRIIGKGTAGIAEVRGSMPNDAKEAAITGFSDGSVRVLITKSSITGFGLNWQHCANTVFVGRSFSYESWYQAVRRFWRFGQIKPVNVHLVVAEGEETISRVIDRKATDHNDMKRAMSAAMQRKHDTSSAVKVAYHPKHKAGVPTWLKV